MTSRDKDQPGAPFKPKAPRKVLSVKPKRPPPPKEGKTSEFEGERIAKQMARVGLCSRRDAEEWIAAGRVAINGKVLESAAINVREGDRVTVDGRPLEARERTRLWLFHKPRGLVTTDKDPEGRRTIFEFLREQAPELPRVLSVGRLDINTEGLLLLTNDGGLSRVLELPATGWLRRYRVRAHGITTPDALASLARGVTIEGVTYAPIDAALDRVQGANSWITLSVREGKNREVRRVLEHLGLEVNRLIRVSYGPFQLGEAPEGTVEEVRPRVLRDQLGEALIAQAGADLGSPEQEERPRWPNRIEKEKAPVRGAGDRVARTRPSEAGEPLLQKPPPPKRKHVTALRGERDARGKGARTKLETGATQDRAGRTIAVERRVPAQPVEERRPRTVRQSDARAAREAEPPRKFRDMTGRPNRPDSRPIGAGRPASATSTSRDGKLARQNRDGGEARPPRDPKFARDGKPPRDSKPPRDGKFSRDSGAPRTERPARTERFARPNRDDAPRAPWKSDGASAGARERPASGPRTSEGRFGKPSDGKFSKPRGERPGKPAARSEKPAAGKHEKPASKPRAGFNRTGGAGKPSGGKPAGGRGKPPSGGRGGRS